jgi:hypothetical protein
MATPMDFEILPAVAPSTYKPNCPYIAAHDATAAEVRLQEGTGPASLPGAAVVVVQSENYLPAINLGDKIGEQMGWFYGIEFGPNKFATIAGMCTNWNPTSEAPLIAAQKKAMKDQQILWAKKHVCVPKKRVCATPYSYPKKSSCGCS